MQENENFFLLNFFPLFPCCLSLLLEIRKFLSKLNLYDDDDDDDE